jgi:hypothetical protein
MKRVLITGALGVLATVTGCATSFTGSAKVDGPKECRSTCNNWGMDLAGMVAMGEYTTGCICKVRGEQLSLSGIAGSVLLSSAGAAGGTAGVSMQMQED